MDLCAGRNCEDVAKHTHLSCRDFENLSIFVNEIILCVHVTMSNGIPSLCDKSGYLQRRSAIDVPPSAPILRQRVPLSERDGSHARTHTHTGARTHARTYTRAYSRTHAGTHARTLKIKFSEILLYLSRVLTYCDGQMSTLPCVHRIMHV